jgi:hypothetical protein
MKDFGNVMIKVSRLIPCFMQPKIRFSSHVEMLSVDLQRRGNCSWNSIQILQKISNSCNKLYA